jgi:FdhE protein
LFGSLRPDDPVTAALAAWDRGYCPACGSWPAVAEKVSADRVLRCSFCAAAWGAPKDACIYCRESGPRFVSRTLGGPDRVLETCGACSGYLKAVTVTELSPFPLLAIADLETMELDLAAMQQGFGRPRLKEFSRH